MAGLTIIGTLNGGKYVAVCCFDMLFCRMPYSSLFHHFLTVQPSIIEISENQTVIETFHLNLNCSAEGSPTPMITWTRLLDNDEVTMPLNFDKIRRQDAGKYRCTADNGVGNPATGDVWIVVQCKFCKKVTCIKKKNKINKYNINKYNINNYNYNKL